MKKIFLPFLLILSLLSAQFSVFAEEPPKEPPKPPAKIEAKGPAGKEPELKAQTAVLMDARSGEVLYSKDGDKRMPPASITKLMTVLLALEKGGDLSDKITFSADAINSIEWGSSNIAIQIGETLTLEQALYGLLLRSANECSNGIAEYVDGSLEKFAEHMTKRAKELGCKDTNFVNANGLHNEKHYTTAYDMALIAKELYKQDVYRNELMKTRHFEIPPTNKQPERRYLHGQQQMLNEPSIYYYPYAIGGKNGFTTEAGNTLVTYAKKDNAVLIAVVMNCRGGEHYTDSAALFDYGFNYFETKQLLSKEDAEREVKVIETYKHKTQHLKTIKAEPEEDACCTFPADADLSTLKTTIDCPDTIEAPVKKGDPIGKVLFELDGKPLMEADLLASESVEATDFAEREAAKEASRNAMLKKIVIVVVILAVLLVITRTMGHFHRKKLHEQQSRRKHRKK